MLPAVTPVFPIILYPDSFITFSISTQPLCVRRFRMEIKHESTGTALGGSTSRAVRHDLFGLMTPDRRSSSRACTPSAHHKPSYSAGRRTGHQVSPIQALCPSTKEIGTYDGTVLVRADATACRGRA